MGERAKFATKLGVIATTVGSAVGLGNIWRFPYEAGMNGGGAFLMIYILCVLILGVPVMCAEFIIGRKSKSDTVDAFKKLIPGSRWYYIGYIGILASILILGYYMVISGWTLEYLFQAACNNLTGKTAAEFKAEQNAFIQNDFRPLLWIYIFLFINYIIISKGVQKGIEKMSNILMPILFIILIVFCIRSLTLPEANEGLKFFLHPDFSKITPQVIVRAMGQAFFSLSLGMGILITYSSYFNNKTHLIKTAGTVAILDTTVAILAGVIIFPAVFSYGVDPVAGPDLVFVTLPNVFNQMAGGQLWGTLFFVFMSFAALSTIIAVFENIISFAMDLWGWERKKAVVFNVILILILSMPCVLGFNIWSDFAPLGAGSTVQDLEDFIVSNNLLPLGSLLYLLFCTSRYGWGWKNFLAEADTGKGVKFPAWARVYVSYILPLIVLFIFIMGYYQKFK